MTPTVTAPGWRVGIDVASVADVERSIARFGSRYLDRLFTADELASCAGTPGQRAAGLAARFAAKEAVIKVLRPLNIEVPWRSIEVRRAAGGWCEIELSGAAKALAEEVGLTGLALSLTHEGSLAAAVVLATSTRPEEEHHR
jgi:holo-[acyl-carrier protein] synthase